MALSGSVSPESMVFDSSLSAKSMRAWDLAGEVGLGVFAFAGEFEVGFDVVGAAGEFGVVGEEGFEAFALAHEGLGTRGVGPDGGVGYFFFDGGEFAAESGRVKDTPADRGLCRGPGSRSIRDR